jgi:hypothetical protein
VLWRAEVGTIHDTPSNSVPGLHALPDKPVDQRLRIVRASDRDVRETRHVLKEKELGLDPLQHPDILPHQQALGLLHTPSQARVTEALARWTSYDELNSSAAKSRGGQYLRWGQSADIRVDDGQLPGAKRSSIGLQRHHTLLILLHLDPYEEPGAFNTKVEASRSTEEADGVRRLSLRHLRLPRIVLLDSVRLPAEILD